MKTMMKIMMITMMMMTNDDDDDGNGNSNDNDDDDKENNDDDNYDKDSNLVRLGIGGVTTQCQIVLFVVARTRCDGGSANPPPGRR